MLSDPAVDHLGLQEAHIMPQPCVAGACDSCHRVKARCIRGPSNPGRCTRCIRLGHVCDILRNVLRRGRRSHSSSRGLVWVNQTRLYRTQAPKSGKQQERYLSPTRSIESDHRELVVFQSVSPPSPSSLLESHLSGQCRLSDEALFQSMRSIDHFLSYFVLGPSFSTNFQSLVEIGLSEYRELVREGCLACAGAVFHARSKKSGFDNINFERSAVGLRKLRRGNVTKRDTGAFLALGLTLATFDLITSGTSAHMITRFTLSLINLSHPSIWMDPCMQSEPLCLIFMDTVECLLRRQIPVIRYRVRDPYLVDRLIGLCSPLLPIMYDVCWLAYESRSRSSLLQQLSPNLFDDLNELVASWRPRPSPDLLSKFSSQEVTCMLTQARVLRMAVSLVLHRLKYPFGVEDRMATRLSTDILSECAICSSIVGEADKLPQTLFPWMMAAIEVTSPEKRLMLLGMELPKSREILSVPTAKMKESIRFVWDIRDAGYATSLFDILEQAPIYVVPL